MTSLHEQAIDDVLIPYVATPEVNKIISGMGRTEDTKFSPDNRWLSTSIFSALVAFK